MIMIDPTYLLLASIGLGVGCFVKGAIGFGLPMIATPIMLFVMPLAEAVALMILPVFVTNLFQVWMTRKSWRILTKIWPMILANITILLSGGQLMMTIDGRILASLLGALILTHALIAAFFLPTRLTNVFGRINPRYLILPAGICSGISGSLTSIYSFPSLQLLVSMRLDKDVFVFGLGVFLLTGYVALWTGLNQAGFPTAELAPTSALLLVPTLICLYLGAVVRNRTSETLFRHFVHIALGLAGITLIVKNLLF